MISRKFLRGSRRAIVGCGKRAIHLVLASVAILIVPAGNAAAQQPAVQATGLRPPTNEEREWMDRNMQRTERVLPNRLGLDRINAELRRRGRPEIQSNVVPIGRESQAGAGAPAGMALSDPATMAAVTAVVPASVDNSTLNAFPPVRSQDYLSSCAAFSTTYYAGTHMLGLARGWNNRNNADNTQKLSPKWTYNLVNGGSDQGAWFSSVMDVMLKLGCPSWSSFPYAGNTSPASNYREWSRDPAVWRSAIFNRFQQVGRVTAVDTSAGLANAKALLANGYVILYATDISGWQFLPASDDLSTTADNTLVGRKVCWMVSANNSGHAMTIVGYNDDIWTDINKNARVDSGEKGAFKVVNSWGSGWSAAGSSDGFGWIAYDALKQASAVSGASNTGRATGFRSAFWGSEVYWITARTTYTPTLLGQFTLSHARRNQLYLRVGSSATSTTTPQSYFPTTTIYGWANGTDSDWPQAFKNLGGAYAFDGGTTAVSGTFVFDLTDLVQAGNRRYYVSVEDNAAGSAASLTDFRLTTPSGTLAATAVTGIPGTADASTARAYADFAQGAVPVITSPAAASGTVGVAFPTYTISASNGPTSFGAAGLPPGLAINTGTGAITGTPTVAGTYTVSLSAINASGTGTGSLTVTVNPQQTASPVITSGGTASGTVGLSFPTYTITASNSPTSFGASGLPPGLAVNTSTGAITGIPTQTGTFNVTVSASNAGGTGTRTVVVTIAQAPVQVPVITSGSTSSGLSGTSFTYRIQASNNPTSYGAQSLPSGLSVNTATGYITGTLPAAGQYDITLVASNAAGSGYLHLILTVTGNNIYGPPNDGFGTPVTLSGNSATNTGSNVNASAQTGEPAHAGSTASRSVWWRWIAPASGSVTINTTGSSFDTVLAVYTGSAVNTLTSVASNNNYGSGTTSQVTFNAVAGTTYQIAVDGNGGATGSVALGLVLTNSNAAANDNFAAAAVLSGSSPAATGGNVNATAQTGEPAHAGNAASHSLWWTWTAPANGTVAIDTVGSDFDTVLGVYTGTAVNALAAVASNDDSNGYTTSRVTFSAIAGTAYRIAVDGWSGRTGSIRLQVAMQTGAPANDNFAGRTTVTGRSFTVSGTNTNATAESNEPYHAGFTAVRSVWWSWTAPASGAATIDTQGSGFDTVLAVYGGSVLSGLARVASNDDSGGSSTSVVAFNAVAGTTYQIAVDGYAGASGSIILRAALVSDDHGNSTATATVVAPTSTTTGNIEIAGDNDYFRINVSGESILTVETSGATDTYGYLLDASGMQVAYDDDTGASSNFYMSYIVPSGTYYVRIKHYSSSGTGSYQFVSSSVPAPVLTIAPATRVVAAAGAGFTFNVTSDTTWSWSDNASWVTSSEAASQSGNQAFTYTVAANTGTSSRSAVITLTGGGLTRTHTITQAGASGGDRDFDGVLDAEDRYPGDPSRYVDLWKTAALGATAATDSPLVLMWDWMGVWTVNSSGKPQVTWWNGSSWQSFAFGNMASADRTKGLAADSAWNILWYIGTDSNLYAAYMSGGAWVNAQIRPGPFARVFRADPAGHHVWLRKTDGSDVVVHWTGSAWAEALVTTGWTTGYSAIDGNMSQLGWTSSGGIVERYWGGAAWQTRTLRGSIGTTSGDVRNGYGYDPAWRNYYYGTAGGSLGWTSLGSGTNGTLLTGKIWPCSPTWVASNMHWVFARDGVGGGGKIRLCYWEGSQWKSAAVAAYANWNGDQAAANSFGWLCFVDPSNGAVKVIHY